MCQFAGIGANQAQENEEGMTIPENRIGWYMVLSVPS